MALWGWLRRWCMRNPNPTLTLTIAKVLRCREVQRAEFSEAL